MSRTRLAVLLLLWLVERKLVQGDELKELRKQAEQGNTDAQNNLGAMYENGVMYQIG
jgi:TPR repeat protein